MSNPIKRNSARVRQPGPDRELDALAFIVAALLGLTDAERKRVLWYLNNRWPEVSDGR